MISVLLPVRNGAACVARAIQSILRQTFDDLELLAIENGSADGTLELLRSWTPADSRLRVVSIPEAGLVGALNRGLSLARGAFIARMDADDWSDARRLELQFRHLERHPETGLVSCLVRHAGNAAAQAGYGAFVEWINSLRTHREISLNRFVESPLAHPSVLFRREIAERLGAWRDGAFPEDYELWLRWLEAGVRMEKVPEVLLEWGDPPDRLSRTDPRYSRRAFYECKAGYLRRWLERAPLNGRALLFWGAGRETRRRLRTLRQLGVRPDGWVDIDPKKCVRRIGGAPVYSPETMPGPEASFVVSFVSTRGARERIAGVLEARGFAPGADYILAG